MKDINRREAIKKVSKYAAFAALGTMVILDPLKAQACSSPPCGHGHGTGNGNGHGHGGWKSRRTKRSIFNN